MRLLKKGFPKVAETLFSKPEMMVFLMHGLKKLSSPARNQLGMARLSVLALAAVWASGSALGQSAYGQPSFEGGYIGAHIGYGFASAEFEAEGIEIIDSYEGSLIGGGHGGYGWLHDRFYAGWELAAGFADVENSRNVAVGGTDWLSGSISRKSGASLRTRLGSAVSDNFLVYGLAGVSVVNVEGRATLNGVGSVSDNIWYPGLQAGGGVEWFVSRSVSVRAQGVYTHYFRIDDPVPGLSDQSYNLNTMAATVGVSWWPER